MSSSLQLVVCVAAIVVVAFAASFAGILQIIALPASIQLLLQVIAVALVVLGLSCCGMYYLNKGIDQADQR